MSIYQKDRRTSREENVSLRKEVPSSHPGGAWCTLVEMGMFNLAETISAAQRRDSRFPIAGHPVSTCIWHDKIHSARTWRTGCVDTVTRMTNLAIQRSASLVVRWDTVAYAVISRPLPLRLTGFPSVAGSHKPNSESARVTDKRTCISDDINRYQIRVVGSTPRYTRVPKVGFE